MTATQTEEQLLAEGLKHFGVALAAVENRWSIEGDQLMVRTSRGPLRYRRGDGDILRCSQAHEYPRWYGACLQCKQREKHSLDPAASYAARDLVERIQMNVLQRKQRLEALRSGAPPSPSRSTWGGPNWARRD